MKDNLNIEKLFKDKFENFEADVNPNLWTNISQGISNGAIGTTGLATGVKVAFIASAVVVTVGVSAYLGGLFDKSQPAINSENIVKVNEKQSPNITVEEAKKDVIIADKNDPIIIENKKEIIKSLNQHTVVYNSETDQTELVVQSDIVTNNSNTNSAIVTTTETEITNVETVNNQTDENTHVNDVVEKDEPQKLIFPTGKMEYADDDNIFKLNFKSNATNAIKYRWDFGDGKTSTEPNPQHTYLSTGEYKVQLTLISIDNEIYQESKIIEIKGSSSIDNVPNVITPNGDRINDEFVIKTTDLKTFSIVITDQFGKTIFESNDPNFSWDGTDLSGNIVEKSMYIYYIMAVGNDGSTYKIPGQLYVR